MAECTPWRTSRTATPPTPNRGAAPRSGQIGENIVTSYTHFAQPFIKYRTHDLVQRDLHPDHGCGWTWAHCPVSCSGAADFMVTIRGTNIYPTAVENLIGGVIGLSNHYELHISRPGTFDEMLVKVEASSPDADRGGITDALDEHFRRSLGVRLGVEVLEPDTLPRYELKTKRIFDTWGGEVSYPGTGTDPARSPHIAVRVAATAFGRTDARSGPRTAAGRRLSLHGPRLLRSQRHALPRGRWRRIGRDAVPPSSLSEPAACRSAPTLPRKRGRPRHEQPSAAYVARQSEIIDVAIEVFKQRGFDQGTLDDVAASLGTGRASLYHYVPSKAHLLYLIFDRAISTTLATMDRLSEIADPGDRLRALIRQQVHTIAANPAMFTVFFGDRPALAERYEADIRPKERRLLRHLIEAVRDASRPANWEFSSRDLRRRPFWG